MQRAEGTMSTPKKKQAVIGVGGAGRDGRIGRFLGSWAGTLNNASGRGQIRESPLLHQRALGDAEPFERLDPA